MIASSRSGYSLKMEYPDFGPSRYSYRVVVLDDCIGFKPILYTNDWGIARHVADTREVDQASLVISADGNVVYDP